MSTFKCALSKTRSYLHINSLCVSTELGHLQTVDAHACDTEDVLLVACCYVQMCVNISNDAGSEVKFGERTPPWDFGAH